jgi:hypothetical protein
VVVITVACVNVENYLGMGELYTDRLHAMVDRNLDQPHRFECITDGEGRTGWWAKTLHFQPGRYSGRVLALDLDTIICGPIYRLSEHKGLLHLADWGWTKNDYGTGIMVFDAGEHAEIYERYDLTVPKRFRGDQNYVASLGAWPALPKGMNVSYRYHAKNGPPAGAVTVSFHGRPKCHEVTTGWVPEHWK